MRGVAVLVFAALALVACGKTTTTTGISVPSVYAGGLRLPDIRSTLDDPSNWWPGPPQFGVRPLDSSTRLEEDRFDITFRFLHNGSAESLIIAYHVYFSSSFSSAILSVTQQASGTTIKGPTAGDGTVYLNQKLDFGAAPYVSQTIVRYGQMLISIIWSRPDAYASTSASGNIAKKIVSKLKTYTSSTSRVSPPTPPDPRLLPPDGLELTRLGTDTLPVEVVPQMVGAPSPPEIAGIFKGLGASDFVFGDYALNADTHMEVQTAAFTFSSSSGSTDWLNKFIGKSNLDQSGAFFNYDDVTGQYIAALGVGSTGVLMICRSAAELEAASRACESPMGRVMGSWKMALGG